MCDRSSHGALIGNAGTQERRCAGCLQAAVAAGDFRRSVHKKLIALEERQIDAQRRTAAVRARSEALGVDIAAARADVARLLQTNQRLRAAVKAGEEWPKGVRAVLASQTLGQVTAEVLHPLAALHPLTALEVQGICACCILRLLFHIWHVEGAWMIPWSRELVVAFEV